MNRKIPGRGDTLMRRIPGTAISIAAILFCTFLLTTCGGGGGGGRSSSGGGGTSGDITPPTPPTGLQATPASTTQIDLQWSPSLDDVEVTGYKVYCDGSYQQSVPSIIASDTGLAPGTQYCYRVAAYDAAGNESFRSGQVCATTSSPTGPQWTARLTGTDMDFKAVNWSGTRYLAVGDDMEVFLSPDSIHWTSYSIPLATPIRLDDVVWNGTQYVGVNGWIYTSPDGINWTIRHTGFDDLSGIAWSGALFAAVGENGTILTSPDGIAWTPRTSGTAEWLFDLTWNGNVFLCVGSAGTILTSPDGVAWTAQTSGTSESIRAVTWTGTAFAAVGSNVALTSPDGVAWTVNVNSGKQLEGVAWSPSLGLFAAVGWNGEILSSPDGAAWTQRTIGAVYSYYDVIWDGTQFVAAGELGEITASSDGIKWTTRTSGSDLTNVVWTGSQFVAVGGYGKILTSPDGVDWVYGTTGTSGDFLHDVAWSGARYVAGAQSYILSSADLVSWPDREWLGATSDCLGVVWAGGQFVCVGDAVGLIGSVQTSPDGMIWTFRDPGSDILSDVAWSPARSEYVAVGQSGTILTSPDGISWTPSTSGSTEWLRGITWTGTNYVTVGSNGEVLTSPDGITWTARNSGATETLYNVSWTGTGFFAVGASGRVIESPDGIAWTPSRPVTASLKGVAWSGSRLVVVGNNSTILTFE